MTLLVDGAAERAFARIINGLRSVREASELTQEEVSSGLPVRGRAVSEWETGSIQPTLHHLLQWSARLNHRLVIVDRIGEPCPALTRWRAGETWECFERRRLAYPLRSRRQALGMAQEQLGELVGVSKDSIQRWELARVPPRPMSCVVWAQKLGYAVLLRPIAAREAVTAALAEPDETPAPAIATRSDRRYAAQRAGSC